MYTVTITHYGSLCTHVFVCVCADLLYGTRFSCTVCVHFQTPQSTSELRFSISLALTLAFAQENLFWEYIAAGIGSQIMRHPKYTHYRTDQAEVPQLFSLRER